MVLSENVVVRVGDDGETVGGVAVALEVGVGVAVGVPVWCPVWEMLPLCDPDQVQVPVGPERLGERVAVDRVGTVAERLKDREADGGDRVRLELGVGERECVAVGLTLGLGVVVPVLVRDGLMEREAEDEQLGVPKRLPVGAEAEMVAVEAVGLRPEPLTEAVDRVQEELRDAVAHSEREAVSVTD